MHRYFIKIPWWIRGLFSSYTWKMPGKEKAVYLSFDDGPHAQITPWVLSELAKYKAQATFFCIGKNVAENPLIFNRIRSENHAVGNHTYNHLNGWKTPTEDYLADIRKASEVIDSCLFRPPYGKIRKGQARRIAGILNQPVRIVMWNVLSADFDTSLPAEKCLSNVLDNVSNGSIIVFHDSEKAFGNLKHILPEILKKLAGEGYKFKKIEPQP